MSGVFTMMPHHWAVIVLAAFAGVTPLGGVRDVTYTVEPRPKVDATELFRSDKLVAVRMGKPVAKARKAVAGDWTGVSTTWFGENVAKFDDEKNGGNTALWMRPPLRLLRLMDPEIAMADQPQGFFPEFKGFVLPWYLLLDATIATSFGALACHEDLYHSRRGKYYNETGDRNNPRERDLEQAKEFIKDQTPYPSAEQAEKKYGLLLKPGKTYTCLPCEGEAFLGLQTFMKSSSGNSPKRGFKGYNEVYCAKVNPEAIVGLMHQSYVYQDHEKYNYGSGHGEPMSTIKGMVDELEEVLGAKLGAYMYGIDATGAENNKFWPIEMDLTD